MIIFFSKKRKNKSGDKIEKKINSDNRKAKKIGNKNGKKAAK